MGKELCIVQANCQGEPLLGRLRTCPEFAQRYECVLFTNYSREPVPDELLGRCSLFLYQFLAPKWGDLSSQTLIGKLPESARHLCIPNMFFTGYWPTWSGREGFDYRCTYLDELVDKGLPAEDVVILYLNTEFSKKIELLDAVSRSLEIERQRQARTPVQYVDLLVANYRDERLYNTVNHPGGRLMNHAARGVLRELGFAPPDDSAFAALGEPFAEFEQPVNPRIAEHFGWNFGGADTQYNVYGRRMSFARYVANYVAARQAGVTDFIGFLQGAHNAI